MRHGQSPLVARLSTPNGQRTVDVTDLEFGMTWRGGFDTATFTLPEWVDSLDPTIAQMARLRVDDTRTGETVWEGYAGDPGKSVSEAEGHTRKSAFLGAKDVLGDRSRPYIAIDTGLEGWTRGASVSQGATTEPASLPGDDDVPALVMQFPAGQPVDNSSVALMRYMRLADGGQRVGGYRYSVVSGFNSGTGAWQTQADAARIGIPGVEIGHTDNFSTTDTAASQVSAGGAVLTVGTDYVRLSARRSSGGATNVTSDTTWSAFHDIVIRSQLVDQTGTDIAGAGAYTNAYVLAHEVIIDALWWFTSQVDIDGSVFDTSFTHQIDQLAYPDGVRLPDMLNDLTLFEPDLGWQVGPTLAIGVNSTGLIYGPHPFTLTNTPVDPPRYRVNTSAGWEQTGEEASVYNALAVYWIDARGKRKSSAYTTAIPVLDQWGRTRVAEAVELADEVGSQANADRIGALLTDQATRGAYSGTLTIDRPVLDLWTGRHVMPWEVVPGYGVLIQDLPDLPPLRLTDWRYSDADQTAKWSLGTPVLTIDQLTAQLARRRRRMSSEP